MSTEWVQTPLLAIWKNKTSWLQSIRKGKIEKSLWFESNFNITYSPFTQNNFTLLSSKEGQSEVPANIEDVDLHFACFVEAEGQIFELDGRKSYPVNHGPSDGKFLVNTAKVISKFMERDPGESFRFWTSLQRYDSVHSFYFLLYSSENLNFTILGLTAED